ncbi:MAG: hypothetical protein ABIQ24_06250, partial [Nitrospiraceae bacterium]
MMTYQPQPTKQRNDTVHRHYKPVLTLWTRRENDAHALATVISHNQASRIPGKRKMMPLIRFHSPYIMKPNSGVEKSAFVWK